MSARTWKRFWLRWRSKDLAADAGCYKAWIAGQETGVTKNRMVMHHAVFLCRGGRTRTGDLFDPNEARYQAAPHPEHG